MLDRGPTPPRVLVDWDFAASGLWRVGPARACALGAGFAGRLPAGLARALADWNREGERLFAGSRAAPTGEACAEFRAAGVRLAEEVQQALGEGWEVLVADAGCWTWVRRPARWAEAPR